MHVYEIFLWKFDRHIQIINICDTTPMAGTTANGNNSVGLGDTTDARTYQIGENQVK